LNVAVVNSRFRSVGNVIQVRGAVIENAATYMTCGSQCEPGDFTQCRRKSNECHL